MIFYTWSGISCGQARLGLTKKKNSLGAQGLEQRVRTLGEQAGPQWPGSEWSVISKNSLAYVFGTEVPINHDNPGPVNDVCSQKMVEGPQCC